MHIFVVDIVSSSLESNSYMHLCPISLHLLVTDPIHNTKVTKDSDVDFKLPDFSKIGEEISSALKESIGKFIKK